MANGGGKYRSLFDCVICFNDMLDRSPRGLQCLHSFCEICLNQLVRNNRITCPTCRKVTEVEGNNVKLLPIDFKLNQMRELVKESDKVRYEQPTDRMTTLQKEAAATKDSIDEEITKLDVYVNKIRHNSIMNSSTESDLLQRKTYHTNKVKEIDKLIIKTNSNSNKFLDIEETCMEIRNQCSKVSSCLDVLIRDKMIAFVDYTELKEKTEDSVRAVREQLEVQYDIPLIELNEHIEIELVNSITMADINMPLKSETEIQTEATDVNDTNVENLTLAPLVVSLPDKISCRPELTLDKLVLDVPKSADINCRQQIDFIGSDVVVINDVTPNHVIQVSQEGWITDKYYLDRGNLMWIRGVAVQKDKIYIVQEKFITVISSTEKRVLNIYKPKIAIRMGKILVDKQYIYITPHYSNPANVYRFDTDQNEVRTVVKNLNKPSYINKANTANGARFIITEYGAHCIRVYDEEWRFLLKFGSEGSGDREFKYPHATAITPMGTLLVADNENNRICHYTINGEFLSVVITVNDGISLPVGLAYKHPYLWVCPYSSFLGYIKCFRMQ